MVNNPSPTALPPLRLSRVVLAPAGTSLSKWPGHPANPNGRTLPPEAGPDGEVLTPRAAVRSST